LHIAACICCINGHCFFQKSWRTCDSALRCSALRSASAAPSPARPYPPIMPGPRPGPGCAAAEAARTTAAAAAIQVRFIASSSWAFDAFTLGLLAAGSLDVRQTGRARVAATAGGIIPPSTERNMTTTIRHADLVESIAAALQYISYYH